MLNPFWTMERQEYYDAHLQGLVLFPVRRESEFIAHPNTVYIYLHKHALTLVSDVHQYIVHCTITEKYKKKKKIYASCSAKQTREAAMSAQSCHEIIAPMGRAVECMAESNLHQTKIA